MKDNQTKYCPICLKKVSVNKNGIVYRHGFKKNLWEIRGGVKNVSSYRRADGESCPGSGKYGITKEQAEIEMRKRTSLIF